MSDFGPDGVVPPDPTALPLHPLTFEPIYQPRVWGGRALEQRFGRQLPDGSIGEAWELVDRPEAVSRVAWGPFRGVDLHTLWLEHPALFGPWEGPRPARFPLLLKLLDCREILSVQVHPGEAAAASLGGEPKAELWVFLETAPGAEIYVGLRADTSRSDFVTALERGGREVVPLLHRLEPRPGDVLPVPPGRLHAIGAGNLVCEIQQNSDTTYRVYDWGRRGLDGRPRTLHLEASLRCIDFDDHEPAFLPHGSRALCDGPWFHVERLELSGPETFESGPRCVVGIVLEGAVEIDWRDPRTGKNGAGMALEAGRCFLLPAGLTGARLRPIDGDAVVLRVTP